MDLASTFSAEAARSPSFAADLKRDLITVVAEGDGMYVGDGRHYLLVGRSALDCIHLAITRLGVKRDDVKSILDFGCGFGRVTRWLIAAFPDAELTAMDIDARALAAVEKVLGIRGYNLDRAWTNLPETQFDLIWVGSLFTHISEQKSELLLSRLSGMLSPGGVLAVTTHGELVADRMRRHERTYNLSDAALEEILGSYDAGSYGFVPYNSEQDYGISVCRASKFLGMGDKARLNPLVFMDRGWAGHQDFFSFRRSDRARNEGALS